MMAAEGRTAEEFAFGFDEPFEPLVLSRTRPINGWLVDTSGEPINGNCHQTSAATPCRPGAAQT